jgi:hypothetical protein
MNKLGIFAAIGMAAVVLAAEAKPPKKPAAPKTTADYFPLKVGYTWTYRNTEEGGYTWKVLAEEPQQGAPPRYQVESLSGVKIHQLYSKADGWVLLHSEDYIEHEGLKATYDPPKHVLPDPLVAGKKWEWTGKDPTQVEQHETYRTVAFENVSVPAGKFRAMKVVTEISAGATPKTRTDWYADGVGLVKSVTQAGQIKYGSELTDYSFKNEKK